MSTPKNISLIGRRHMSGGNTYHTVVIVVDGEQVHKSERTYGYGDHYVTTAKEWLRDNGYAFDRDTPIVREVSDVRRRKDL